MQAYASVTQMFAVYITLILFCVVKGLMLSQGLKKRHVIMDGSLHMLLVLTNSGF